MIFFTADTHLQHANILKYCKRPFADTDEMDKAICANWNGVVGVNDTVYHLGDVAFAGIQYLEVCLNKLNGKKYLVPGNHDFYKNRIKILEQFFTILPVIHTETFQTGGNNYEITMCHYPMQSWNHSFHGALHFYGHVHGRIDNEWQRLDVGVDCWNFQPVPLALALKSVKIPTQEDRDARRCLLE